jgi:NADPH:quinone reductase-like Zn-dependent oxidoreductase
MTIPLADSMSFEEGSALPLASITASLVIFQQLGFPLPGTGKKNVPFLVWGGASSVGMYAIQLAALAGATVIATASKDNHELLKSLGAKYTFDYKDSDVIDQIKKAAGGEVEYGIDCVSVPETVGQGAKAYGSNGKVGLILPVDKSKSGDSIEHKNVIMYCLTMSGE